MTAPLRRRCLSIAIMWVLRAYQYRPHNGEVSIWHAMLLPLFASCAVRAGAWMCEYSIKAIQWCSITWTSKWIPCLCKTSATRPDRHDVLCIACRNTVSSSCITAPSPLALMLRLQSLESAPPCSALLVSAGLDTVDEGRIFGLCLCYVLRTGLTRGVRQFSRAVPFSA